ncbi:competence/damage-inducible protein A [Lacticaseibacillus sharpeae]|nr:competence/damage-inducible protein A [Lacticaseibacillus sharpeae]
MDAELIAVGTEMLLGEIVNTNAAYLARGLSQVGVTSHYQQIVGDNPERLDAAITVAEQRSQMIILMGGLGPTKDDLTKQVLAKHLGLQLVEDAAHRQKLDDLAKQRQKVMTPNNLAQALYPEGAVTLTNHVGLAVGAIVSGEAHQYVLLPGPPREFTVMVDRELLPRLMQGEKQHLVSRTLRFFGLGESALVTAIGDIIDGQDNPTVAPYIKDYEVTLRLTASAVSEAAANTMLDQLQARILAVLAPYYYATGANVTLAQTVVQELIARKISITAAESLTAGLFQATLGSVAGVSAVFPGGFVTYAPTVKHQLVGVNAATIADYGVVSRETACAMAEGARSALGTEMAVSFTGVAGPDSLEGHPAGTVWIGLATATGVRAEEFHLGGHRNEVRIRCVKTALMMLLHELRSN